MIKMEMVVESVLVRVDLSPELPAISAPSDPIYCAPSSFILPSLVIRRFAFVHRRISFNS